jgi:CMP/dCMP kinase
MSADKIITIDGPAASGKSSVARLLANHLGWACINTGNMYRAITLGLLKAGVDVHDEAAVVTALPTIPLENVLVDGRNLILLSGQEVENELNSEDVNNSVSHVAKVPQVRTQLVAMQRDLGLAQPSVMEGRDIGTVVFPEASAKFYIDASEEVRARRRGDQGLSDSVRERDRMDSTRKTAPLMAAADAVIIDSSELSLQEVVDKIVALLPSRGVITSGKASSYAA